jgi:hypothetical protein
VLRIAHIAHDADRTWCALSGIEVPSEWDHGHGQDPMLKRNAWMETIRALEATPPSPATSERAALMHAIVRTLIREAQAHG